MSAKIGKYYTKAQRALPRRNLDLSGCDILVVAVHEALKKDAPIELLRGVIRYVVETKENKASANPYGLSPSDPMYWRSR